MMTPSQKEAKRRAEVMLAYAEGKEIEARRLPSTTWKKATTSSPTYGWYWDDYDYRVAPEKLKPAYGEIPPEWDMFLYPDGSLRNTALADNGHLLNGVVKIKVRQVTGPVSSQEAELETLRTMVSDRDKKIDALESRGREITPGMKRVYQIAGLDPGIHTFDVVANVLRDRLAEKDNEGIPNSAPVAALHKATGLPEGTPFDVVVATLLNAMERKEARIGELGEAIGKQKEEIARLIESGPKFPLRPQEVLIAFQDGPNRLRAVVSNRGEDRVFHSPDFDCLESRKIGIRTLSRLLAEAICKRLWPDLFTEGTEKGVQVRVQENPEEKPPLGIVPRSIWIEQRKVDLIDAIHRHKEAGRHETQIVGVWARELSDLIGK